MKRLIVPFVLLPAAALAECPPVADTADSTAMLLTELVTAPDERVATEAANELWQLWMVAPDTEAQRLLNDGMERRAAYDFEASEALLDRLVAYCPHYPEAYNQRAFTRFLRQDYDGALEDLDRVLEDVPHHFGALSGKAMSLMQQGRAALAQEALRAAVKVHPYLRERSLIVDVPEKDI